MTQSKLQSSVKLKKKPNFEKKTYVAVINMLCIKIYYLFHSCLTKQLTFTEIVIVISLKSPFTHQKIFFQSIMIEVLLLKLCIQGHLRGPRHDLRWKFDFHFLCVK